MYIKSLLIFLISLCCSIHSAEFSISSYNGGGLSEHYDYIRAGSMQKLMQERYSAESEAMERIEKVQGIALKILFAKDPGEQKLAADTWENEGFKAFYEYITTDPADPQSPNAFWQQKSQEMVTPYNVRPIELYDLEVKQSLEKTAKDLADRVGIFVDSSNFNALLSEGRNILTRNTLQNHLKHDIICLQEASYLDSSMFAENYKVLFADSLAVGGIAWNDNRFQLLENIGDLAEKGFAIKLLDRETGEVILATTCHLTGCNPFFSVDSDSLKGDSELKAILKILDAISADIKLIGMDANVSSTHPRLKLLKKYGYQLDTTSPLEMTCTNPYLILNTRLDWIAVKSNPHTSVKITNIPIPAVELNNIQNNASDHKPIAALIDY